MGLGGKKMVQYNGKWMPEDKANKEAAKAASAAQIDRQEQARKDAYYNQQEQRKQQQNAAARAADLAKGQARGEQIFGNQALGRVDASRSADMQDVLARRKANLGGYTPEEQQAMREQNMGSILASQKMGARDLARQQARSGVRGALAANQMQAQNLASQGQLADQERQLFLQNIANKRDALGQYEQSAAGMEKGEFDKQAFNLGQGEKELQGKLSTEFGYGGMGAQDRAAALQSVLGSRAEAVSKEIAEKTKGKK